LAVEGLLAGASVRQACEWLGLGWDAAQEIMRRAVGRGWERRQRDQRPPLGLDEKSCQRGHSDLPLLTDWDPSRVLAVVAERTGEAADPWWATLTPEQKAAVAAVAVDRWKPFIQTIARPGPAADLVPDRFHVRPYLNASVDQVRRQEHQELLAEVDATLRGPGHWGGIIRSLSARSSGMSFPGGRINP
jgi:transposase